LFSSKFPRHFWFAISLLGAASLSGASAQPQSGGDLSGMWTRGPAAQSWYRQPESGPGPVQNLTPPAPTDGGGAGTTYIGDHTNPILQPWAAEVVKRRADAQRAGTPEMSAQQVCRPHGVPYILQLNDSVQFLHTPDLFVILYAREGLPRIIYMNVEHPENVGWSTYGHSIGHWEGDTLVVDTIGLTDDTSTGRMGTPHTDRMRVVERYSRIAEDDIRVDFMVEDPSAFTIAWRGVVNYRPDTGSYHEQPCAENNINTLTGLEADIPKDLTPDF
jgi:hypothetical protein